MAQIMVVGPLASKAEADETAKVLGKANHSVYSRYKNDAEGFVTDKQEWFVERDTEAQPERIFGMSWEEIQSKQSRRS